MKSDPKHAGVLSTFSPSVLVRAFVSQSEKCSEKICHKMRSSSLFEESSSTDSSPRPSNRSTRKSVTTPRSSGSVASAENRGAPLEVKKQLALDIEGAGGIVLIGKGKPYKLTELLAERPEVYRDHQKACENLFFYWKTLSKIKYDALV
jgi:hypothetical protein